MFDISEGLDLPKIQNSIPGVNVRRVELAGREGPRVGIEICAQTKGTGIQLLLHKDNGNFRSPGGVGEELITGVEGIFFVAGINLRPQRFMQETTFVMKFDDKYPTAYDVELFGRYLGALLESGIPVSAIDEKLAQFHPTPNEADN